MRRLIGTIAGATAVKLVRLQLSFVAAIGLEAGAGAQLWRGNPICWDGPFTYDTCCESEQAFHESGCYSPHFNFEVCCVEPYRPSRQCLAAVTVSDQLWHCRARPHVEVDRCFKARSANGLRERSEPSGMVMHFHGGYEAYVRAQQDKAGREIDDVFAHEPILEVVSRYLSRHFDQSSGQLAGLCHGAKTGTEVRRLRAMLGRDLGGPVEVFGTDLSEQAAARSGGDVLSLDFHLIVHQWTEKWDFVYSNALDHSFQPATALLAWRRSLREPESLVVLHRSTLHDRFTVDAVDMYGGSLGDYCTLLAVAGFEVLDVIRIPVAAFTGSEDLIFARKGSTPNLGLLDEVKQGSDLSNNYAFARSGR